jgi:hypothetical protein
MMLGSYVDVEQPRGVHQASPQAPPSRALGFRCLTEIFELASTHTRVNHPLCPKCLEHVMRELQDQTKAAEAQAKAYEAALDRLQVHISQEVPSVPAKAGFYREIAARTMHRLCFTSR